MKMNETKTTLYNLKLAHKASEALTAKSGFEKQSGYCCRFVRQVIQAVYGNKYDKYFKASAYETMLAFKDSPYAVKLTKGELGGGSVIGDILFKGNKTSGKFGHVGIRVAGNKIAENSSAHFNEKEGDHDARGTRSLQAWGDFEL